MKIIVTGASGMLGTDLCSIFKDANHEIYPTDVRTDIADMKYLDICNSADVLELAEKIRPNMIIHLAAETNVDKCETQTEHAFKVNTLGTQNMALAAKKVSAVMVYLSTAAIFGSRKGAPYTEDDIPKPISVYAKSKLEGEQIVQKLLDRFFIVRAGWMIGGGRGKDKKFVAKIIDILDKSNSLKAVSDKEGTPTYTVDLANCLLKLIETNFYGVYHMANTGACTRFDIAKEIVKILGRRDVKVEPVSSDVFPLPAPRGKSEAIRNYMLEKRHMNCMRSWQEALRAYIEKEFKDKIR